MGPTAAGKSALAVRLALALGGEVINADSMQLYRGMDIGTAKLTAAERGGVPHHLLDIWDVRQTASVADYQRLARAVIEDIAARGRVPVLTGGSGLYIRAAVEDLNFPGTDPRVRDRLEAELAAGGPAALHARLTGLDPAAAASILPSNGRRIVRALEVIEISGGPFTATLPAYESSRPAVQIGVRVPRDELDRRITARVDQMWAAGFEHEVRRLERAGLRDGKTASRALGYAQMLRHLAGEWTLEQAREETVRATKRFARRQESWFRRDPRITWLNAGTGEGELLGRALSVINTRLSRADGTRAPPSDLPSANSQRQGGRSGRRSWRPRSLCKFTRLLSALGPAGASHREYEDQGHSNVQPWIDSSIASLHTPSAKQLADEALAQNSLGWLERARQARGRRAHSKACSAHCARSP